jgi:phage shock protein B
MDDIAPILICGILFLGLPWIFFHYITQWKKNGSLSVEDENLLDDLHETARKLDDRMRSIERIIAADNPDFRPTPSRLSDLEPRDREIT